MPLPTLTDAQTNRLLAVLSLDLSAPFYPDIGLPFGSRTTGFQQCLRTAFADLRTSVERDASVQPDVAASTVSSLQSGGCSQEASTLLRWCPQAFLGHHADQPALSGWGIVFNRWAHAAYAHPAPVHLQPLVSAMSADYLQRLEASGLAGRVEAIKTQPLSSWDLSMFARHGWADSEFSHPSGVLASLAEANAMTQAWRQQMAKAPPDALASLCRHADQILDVMGIWMPGPISGLPLTDGAS